MGNVILGLLLVSPGTLYSLKKQFESGVSLFYSASLGSLGTALSALLARGLVDVVGTVENGRSKKVYTITPQGRAAFLAWMVEPITQRDLEAVALSKLYFFGSLAADERAVAQERIEDRLRADEAELIGLARQLDGMAVAEEHSAILFYRRQVLEYGLRSHALAREFFAQLGEAPR
jgi:DNA-binding PadR family transcriptional regulator